MKINTNIICKNRYINYKFNIYKTIEAGISLKSWEIKAIKARQVNISNSYVSIKNRECYLIGAKLKPTIECCSHIRYTEIREIKLLLHKNEINYLLGKITKKKYTIVILSIYWKYIWVKVKIGLAIGRKKQDKRFILKNKEWQLEQKIIYKNLKKY